jgi:[acyl-carrier-protein] S-malonyltransferase
LGKIAFIFAGQGSQTPGMGKDLYNTLNEPKKIFDLAGEEVKKLTFNGTAEELNITINTQPCLFATDLACAAALNEKGIFAQGAAGFSLGEVPAAAYCGILSQKDAFDFVKLRAFSMQECAAKNKGIMLAVLKLSAPEVEELCKEIPGSYPANYNCPGQTVVACSTEAEQALISAVAAKKGRAIKLAVSGAFHTPFMDAAAATLKHFLENKPLSPGNIPLYANATGTIYDDAKSLLSRQVNSPVLWQKTIENMILDGFDTFIEVGPGKVLSGLVKKISTGVTILNVSDTITLQETLKALDA